MSKAKKIVSLLLAVAMVLTIAPVSVLGSAYLSPNYKHWGDTAGDAHGELEYSTTAPAAFYPDTSGTSPVIRVAAGDNSYVLGTTVVRATPSGIPAYTGTGSTYNSVALNGETPDFGYVRFKLYGAEPQALPTISPDNNVTCTAYGNPTTTTVGGQTVYEAVWQIAGSTGTGVPAGTDITFTITYKVNGTTYETYAFTHVENILVGSGVAWHHSHLPTFGSNYRMAWGTQILGKNVYNGGFGPNGDTAKASLDRGYINWFSATASGGSLAGLGNEDNFSSTTSAFGVQASAPQAGMIKWRQESGNFTGSKTNWKLTSNDGNRARAVIYTDLGEPVSSSRLRDLNFRLAVITGEGSNFSSGQFNGWYPYTGQYDSGENEPNTTSGGQTAVSSSVWSGATQGTTSGLGSVGQSFNLRFSGTGPTSTGTYNYSFGIKFQASGTLKGGWYQNMTFIVYNKAQLKSFLTSIAAGQATAYNGTTYNVTGGYTKGAFPNANTYAGDAANLAKYNTFISAFKAAAKVMQKPDTNQTEINNVISTLATAYRALPDYVAQHTVTVHHYQTGTTDQVADDKVYTVYHGDNVTAYCLKSVEGYSVVSTNTVQTGTIMADTEFTFYYNPKQIALIATKNDDANGTATQMINFNDTFQIYTDPADPTTSTINYGTKAHYTFAGWYTDSTLTQPLAVDSNGNFTMTSTTAVPIYGKWEITPIKIKLDQSSAGLGVNENYGTVTPNPDYTVYFNQPASDPDVAGYIFTGYFEQDMTTPITFPIPFQFGDSDKTLYAKYRDVNGKIVFESNGGTQVADATYNVGDSVNAPAEPTKVGYTFGGWFLDNGTFQQQIVWPQTMNSTTGFVAYAKWIPRQVKIVFNTNVGARPSEYDTRSMPDIIGAAGEPLPADDVADYNDPQRFGYSFLYWETPEGLPYTIDENATFPITDDLTGANNDEYVLTAQWKSETYSAFLKLNGYEKLSGEYVETDTAQHGDIITVRMKTKTNFFIGSSAYVFMYDKTFFELVGSGSDAIKVNSSNDYITGIGVDASDNRTFNVAYDNNGNLFNWPAGSDASTYNAIMVALDPNVLDGYTSVIKAQDDTWMIEFQLRVLDTAEGTGKIYMDKTWSRTEDNMMGTMFYGAATAANTPVYNTTNDVVEPNTNLASVLITIDETPTVETTVIADPNGGTWADNTTAPKTYTGAAETEILGWADPVRVGYHLDDSSATAAWYSDPASDATWVGGYYASEDADGKTFKANWIPNDYTVNFYWDTLAVAPDPVVYRTFNLGYETVIAAPTAPTRTGYTLAYWADANGNEVTFDENGPLVPLDGADYYAVWTAAPVNVTVRFVRSGGGGNLSTFQALSGSTVQIVTALPVDAATCTTTTVGSGNNTWTLYYHEASNTYYILDTETGLFRAQGRYSYDREANELPITATVAADGSTILTVNYLGSPVTITWDANGGKFADDSTSKTESGRAGDLIAGPGENPTRVGYTLNLDETDGYAIWMYNTSAAGKWVPGDTTMVVDRTYRAQWTAKTVTVRFVVVNPVDGTTQQQDVETTFDAQLTAPAELSSYLTVTGYDFNNLWATAPGGEGAALGTVTHENDATTGIAETYYAVFTPHDYNIIYNVLKNGAAYTLDPNPNTTAHMGDSITLAAAPSETGYTFEGWTADGSTYAPGSSYTVATADVTFSGTLTPITVTNNFNYNYGDPATVVTADSTYDQAVVLPDEPTRQGYGFLGWSTDPAATEGEFDLGTQTATAPTTYYAIWEAHNLPYSVNIYLQNADNDEYTLDHTITDLEGLVGSEVTYTLEPIANYTPKTASVSGTIPTDAGTPLVLNAYYDRVTFTLTYVVDGETYAEQTYRHGAAVTAPADPTKEGYTFSNWSPAVPATMPTGNMTVTAVFTINQYDVNFYKEETDDAAYYTLSDRDFGSVITAPTAPTKTGYVFAGWYDKTDATKTVVTFDASNPTVPARDVDYVAKWDLDSFKLQYVYGATVVEEFDVEFGTAKADMPVSASEPAHRAGWTFTGWDVDSLPATMPAQTVQIQAKWEQNVYNVTYNAGEGAFADETASHVLTHHYGDDPMATGLNGVAYEEPTREGYDFTGWTPAVPGAVGETDITVTAVYEARTYTITFDTDGGSAIENIVAAYDEEYTVPANPTKVGYTFDHWENADTGETFEFPADHKMDAYNDDADQTLYLLAIYEINSHTLTLDLDGGAYAAAPAGYVAQENGTYTLTVNYGTVINTPADPAKEGYTFAGWQPAIPTAMPDSDPTAVAQWTINQYTITFNTDGGTAIAPITQDYGTAVTAPADPTKEGYTFAGWDVEIPATMPAENKTITAQWTINQYTITFDTDGGSAIAPITQDYGTAVTAPADPTKEGYTFAGWDVEIPATMPAENKTITAQWTINQYTITFDTDGGTAIAPITQDYGTAVTAPADPTKDGYTFAGWDVEIPSTMPAENKTITAQWNILDNLTVTFDPNGGAFDADGSTEAKTINDVTFGTALNPGEVSRDGYTFEGWFDANDNAMPATMPSANATYYAKWTAESDTAYKIGYYYMDTAGEYGAAETTVTAAGQTDTTATATAEQIAAGARDGFTFDAENSVVSVNIDGDGNAEIKLMFKRNAYTFTYVIDGVETAEDYLYEAVLPTVTVPDKTGYTNLGWYDAAEGGAATTIPATMPLGDLTVYARYQINQYTITFDTDGGTAIAPITQDYATAVQAPADPTKVGYTFAGWDVEIPATMPAENLTITAQWEILTTLKVTYDPNGGYFTADDSTAAKVVENVTFGAALEPGEVARDGYTFSGWFTAAEGGDAMPAAMPGEDATYYAQWIAGEATAYTIEYYYQNAADLTAYDRDDALTDTTNVGETDTTATVTEAQINAGAKEGFVYNADASTLSGTIAGDGSLVLKVYFDRESYTVTFRAEGDTTLETSTQVVYGTNVTAPEAPAKTGERFIGWAAADDANQAMVVFPVVMPAHALSYIGVYDPASYPVEYYVDGVRVATALGTYGDAIMVPPLAYEVPTGYQLGATWYTDAAMTTPFSNGTITTETVKLYNTLSPIEYNAIFDPNGGQFADSTTGNKTVVTAYGADIAAPADPTRDGYTFQGWSPDVGVMEARDMTFVATWIETSGAYTLTYYLDDATTVWAAFPVALNDEFDVPADPVKEGYVFQGWAEKDDATNTVITLPATVTENRELKAVFTIDQFTATIQQYVASAHGPAADPTLEVKSETDYDYQANVALPTAEEMAITNYTFTGWVATDENGAETVIAPDGTLAMPASDLTIVPTYERVAVKLVPKTGTTTVIERKIGTRTVKESYNDNSVTTAGYNATTFTDWYVYGLKTNIRNLTTFVGVQGDGTVTFTRSTLSGRGYGTGAKITVTDNVTGEVVEEFIVIIFGDLNGDAKVASDDLTAAKNELNDPVWSSTAGRIAYLFRAANLDGDRRFTATDTGLLSKAVNGSVTINQITGRTVAN